MDNASPTKDYSPSPASASAGKSNGADSQTKVTLAISAGLILLVGLVAAGGYFLIRPETDTAKWRDAFLVALSLELFFLGFISVILIFQLVRLVNLIQNEVRPVLKAANETMNTVRGTADFLSSNLVNPVVKVNSYMAAARRLLAMVNIKL